MLASRGIIFWLFLASAFKAITGKEGLYTCAPQDPLDSSSQLSLFNHSMVRHNSLHELDDFEFGGFIQQLVARESGPRTAGPNEEGATARSAAGQFVHDTPLVEEAPTAAKLRRRPRRASFTTTGVSFHDETHDMMINLASFGLGMLLVYVIFVYDIRQAMRDMIKTMICTFCAALIFAGAKEIVDLLDRGHDADLTLLSQKQCISKLILRFVMSLTVVQVVFLCCQSNYKMLKHVASLGLRVVAFASIDLFGSVLHDPALSKSFSASLEATALMSVILAAIFYPSHVILTRLNPREEFVEYSLEAHTESFGLCLGFLMSMLVRYSVTGHLPPVYDPFGTPQSETLQLFGASVCLGAFVLIASIIPYILPNDSGLIVKKAISPIQSTISMAMGWCLLFSWYCAYNSAIASAGGEIDNQLPSRIFMALVFSAFAFGSMFFISTIVDCTSPVVESGFRSFRNACALTICLTWVGTSTEALTTFTDVSETYVARIVQASVATICICFFLLSVSDVVCTTETAGEPT